MKISNEVKLGSIALITIIAFILMFKFLRGTALFTSTSTYHVVYENIAGLTRSNPVEINGYQAGVVQNVKLINDGSGRILVSMTIDKRFNIPTDSRAEITTATLIAGMKIVLRMGESRQWFHNHDTMPGYVSTSIIDRLSDSFEPLEKSIYNIITGLDSVVTSLNMLLSPELTGEVKSAITNINGITTAFNEISGSRKDELMAAIDEFRRFTSMLAVTTPSLDSTIRNLEEVTETIAEADLGTSLAALGSSLNSLDSLLRELNRGEGTAGKLVRDDSLYINLSNSLNALDLLLHDLKENPGRYVHFSLFGKKER